MPSNDDNATRALEWMVTKLEQAKSNGYYLDKISTMSVFPAGRQAYAPSPSASVTGSGGASQADVDAALARASKAESEVSALSDRVAKLEKELRGLATHLEEAVGPHEEGEHKTHWWSRR